MNKDKKLIEEFLTRGVANILPTEKDLEKLLLSGRQLRIYTGIDPTGENVHLGHGVVFRKLAMLHKLGHKIIVLIGNFTAMIGDPDKSAARTRLTKEQVEQNMAGYIDQLSHIFNFNDKENPVEIRYNADWLGKLNFGDVIEVASHFTVQQMLERDMFEKRMNEGKPIYIHEFMYPLMQGFDSVALDVDLEIGGNDQTFNMLAGRTLLRAMKNKEKLVMALELLVDADGKKMSKTDNNFVSLANDAKEMFGKVMSWTDGMIINSFRILTDVSLDEIAEMEKQMKGGANPRDLKVKLAYEVTRIFKGEADANLAKENFDQVFSKGNKPTDIETKFSSKKNIIDAMMEVGLITSKSEGRQLIKGKGVKVNDEVVDSIEFQLPVGTNLVQKGKRHFVNISVE
jgi:tyrosyl-tRNA synthetase